MIWRRGRDSLATCRPIAGTAASAPYLEYAIIAQLLILLLLKPNDLAARLLGWPSSWERIRLTLDLHQGDLIFPGFAALVGFGVQLCGLGGRASAFAQRKNRDFPCVRTVAYGKRIAGFQHLRRFDPFAVDLHLATIHRFCRQTAGFEEAGRPKPFVDPYTNIRVSHSCGTPTGGPMRPSPQTGVPLTSPGRRP